jgi:hypothetical protein
VRNLIIYAEKYLTKTKLSKIERCKKTTKRQDVWYKLLEVYALNKIGAERPEPGAHNPQYRIPDPASRGTEPLVPEPGARSSLSRDPDS